MSYYIKSERFIRERRHVDFRYSDTTLQIPSLCTYIPSRYQHPHATYTFVVHHIFPLLHALPALPSQLTDPPRNMNKALLKPRPPPLTCLPLPLQPWPLMKPLRHHIPPNFIPRHQAPQHANAPNQIPPPAHIQLHRPPIARVQPRIVRKRLFLLRCQARRLRRLVGQFGVHKAVV